MPIRVVPIAERLSLIDDSVSSAGAAYVEPLHRRHQLISNFFWSFVVSRDHGHELLHVIEPNRTSAELRRSVCRPTQARRERPTVMVGTVA